MRTRTIPTTIFLSIIFTVIAVLLFGYSISARDIASSSAQDTVVEYPAISTVFGELDSGIQKTAESTSDSINDGPSLLARHCTKCHTAQSLRRIKKQRAEWEMTLVQMERMGVRLSDIEKDVLLDYLVVTDSKP